MPCHAPSGKQMPWRSASRRMVPWRAASEFTFPVHFALGAVCALTGCVQSVPPPGASGHSLCVRTQIFFPDVETQFSSRFEQCNTLCKIDHIVYDGDIEVYIDKIEIVNTRVGLSGVIRREKLKGEFTKPMKKKLSNVGQLSEDDIEFVEVLWKVGKNLEDEVKQENRSHQKLPDQKKLKENPRVQRGKGLQLFTPSQQKDQEKV